MAEKNVHAAGGVVTVTAWLGLVVLATLVLKSLAFLFIPLSIALLFCYALGIPMEWLGRLRVPGHLRIFLAILFVLICFYLLGGLLKVNIAQFQERLPEFEQQFWVYTEALCDRFDVSPDEAREMVAAQLQSFGQTDLKPVGAFVRSLGDALFTLLGNVIWVLLFMGFILAEKQGMASRLVQAIGEEKAAPVLEAAHRINKAVQSYLGLKTMVSLLTGVLVSLVILFFGVHFALLWGVLAFLFNFIPNIGSLIATIPPVAITLFQTGSVAKAVAVGVAISAVQMGVGNFLEPKIMGKGLNLSPLVVLLSLVFWGWMWGMTGMLLSVPLTAAIKIALEQLDSTRPVAILMSGK